MDNSVSNVRFTKDEIKILCAFATLFLDSQEGRLKEMDHCISKDEVEESWGANE